MKSSGSILLFTLLCVGSSVAQKTTYCYCVGKNGLGSDNERTRQSCEAIATATNFNSRTSRENRGIKIEEVLVSGFKNADPKIKVGNVIPRVDREKQGSKPFTTVCSLPLQQRGEFNMDRLFRLNGGCSPAGSERKDVAKFYRCAIIDEKAQAEEDARMKIWNSWDSSDEEGTNIELPIPEQVSFDSDEVVFLETPKSVKPKTLLKEMPEDSFIDLQSHGGPDVSSPSISHNPDTRHEDSFWDSAGNAEFDFSSSEDDDTINPVRFEAKALFNSGVTRVTICYCADQQTPNKADAARTKKVCGRAASALEESKTSGTVRDRNSVAQTKAKLTAGKPTNIGGRRFLANKELDFSVPDMDICVLAQQTIPAKAANLEYLWDQVGGCAQSNDPTAHVLANRCLIFNVGRDKIVTQQGLNRRFFPNFGPHKND